MKKEIDFLEVQVMLNKNGNNKKASFGKPL